MKTFLVIGIISLTATLIVAEQSYSCDFERDTCGFTNEEGQNTNWARKELKLGGRKVYGMVAEINDTEKHISKLITPYFEHHEEVPGCLTFDFYVSGDAVKGFSVEQEHNYGITAIWTLGNSRSGWQKAQINVDVDAATRFFFSTRLDPSLGENGDRFNSYQVIYSQFGLAIHQNDHQARRRFVEWAQNEIAVLPDFHKRILFSDEAHFWLNGYVNKQNCRIWSEANPQVYVETPLHPEKLTELWFQQDGATCHTARATIDLLKDTFGDRLISRFGPVNWPPRSCDLTPLDYFLWGYVKSLFYADKPQTLDHLEDNIRRVIADIRPQMLEKVIENWTSRLDYIRASRGSPMPEIIFKM
ncbi:u21-Nephitoxin-Nsp1b_1 [Trichonephila clavipes]|nr:u21-Nephitoxin-Nsp1b_1 [Trichonephila clavipes]